MYICALCKYSDRGLMTPAGKGEFERANRGIYHVHNITNR